jgi:hypothetical protein
MNRITPPGSRSPSSLQHAEAGAGPASPSAAAQQPTPAPSSASQARRLSAGAPDLPAAARAASHSAAPRAPRRALELTGAPLVLAGPGNRAIEMARHILRHGPSNQAFALAHTRGGYRGRADISKTVSAAFLQSQTEHLNQPAAALSLARKLSELFAGFVNHALGQLGPDCPPDAFIHSPAALRRIQVRHAFQPEALRISAAMGAGACDDFAVMTAWLSACEMATQGLDGFVGVFGVAPGEARAALHGFDQPHVVAGSFQSSGPRFGVDSPCGRDFMVLDAWQESAAAMPMQATKIRDRLITVPDISFQVKNGQILGVRQRVFVPGAQTTLSPLQSVSDFPGPKALQALADCRITNAGLAHVLRQPESSDPSNRLALTQREREWLDETIAGRLAEDEGFNGGHILGDGNPFGEVQCLSDVAAVLHFDRQFAISNQIFGSHTGLSDDAAQNYAEHPDGAPYSPGGHLQPYPGMRPTSPVGRQRLAAVTVTTDPMADSGPGAAPSGGPPAHGPG